MYDNSTSGNHIFKIRLLDINPVGILVLQMKQRVTEGAN